MNLLAGGSWAWSGWAGSWGRSSTSTMDRDTLGVGSGGGGAVGPLLGVSTTLPLQQGTVEDNHYQIQNYGI